MTTTATERSGELTGGQPARSGATPLRLIKSELLKIWTTNSWWIFGIVTLVFTGLALLVNVLQAADQLHNAEIQQNQPPPDFGGGRGPDGEVVGGPPPAELEQMRQQYLDSINISKILINSAANIYTSGQFFTLLFMVILGALIVTNEFFHQTATTTFLTTPHRTNVILSKLAAAVVVAGAFWAVVTTIDLVIGSLFLSSRGYSLSLSEWPVQRSVLMNLLAFVIWAILGIGLGVLIRSQLGATLTGAAMYLLSFPIAFLFFGLVRQFIIKHDWVWQGMAFVPGVASNIMVAPERMTLGYSETGPIYGPTWWAGALVLVGYGLIAGGVGTLITRKRDIS